MPAALLWAESPVPARTVLGLRRGIRDAEEKQAEEVALHDGSYVSSTDIDGEV